MGNFRRWLPGLSVALPALALLSLSAAVTWLSYDGLSAALGERWHASRSQCGTYKGVDLVILTGALGPLAAGLPLEAWLYFRHPRSRLVRLSRISFLVAIGAWVAVRSTCVVFDHFR